MAIRNINIKVEEEMKNTFHKICVGNNTTMTDVLKKRIVEYIEENSE